MNSITREVVVVKKYSRREELIQVAIELFATYGYAGTSIRDIAKVTGHSVSNVYHYFENKEALWLAILEHSSKGIPEHLKKTVQKPGEPIECFTRMLHSHLKEAVKHQREAKIFFIDEDRLSPKGKKINQRVQREFLNLYKEQLLVLQDNGVIQSRNLSILAFNILGVINWHLRWQEKIRNMRKQDVRTEVVNFILRGMGVGQVGQIDKSR